MAIAIPQWHLGKNVLWIGAAITIGTTGLTTVGSTVSFFGVLQDSSEENSVDKVAVSPTDNPNRNKVIIEQGAVLTLTEFLQAATPSGTVDSNTGISVNALEYLSRQSFHYQFTSKWRDNAAGVVRTAVYYTQFINLNESYSKAPDMAKMTMETFSLMSAGAYITNPAYS